jgi:probable F420-dependent oxidoreductase
MKFGIAIRNMGPQSTPECVKTCAQTAERCGFDALFFSDHLAVPPDQAEGSGGRYLDALTTLGFLAGVTSRIRLGVSVLILPYRPAVLTAKQIATVQELSGGRMILGTGVGWMKGEFQALGVDSRKRGALTTETLRVIHHLFETDTEPFSGELVNFPPFVFLPRPQRPPIWIGGSGPNAIERVVAFGDGWHPMLPPAELKPAVEILRGKARAANRGELEVVARRGLKLEDLGADRERLRADREAGATYFIFDPGRYADAAEFAKRAGTFITEIASRSN